ncbi:MAG: ROK family transcriptional regulator [Hyphomicrobiaceae bacterium]
MERGRREKGRRGGSQADAPSPQQAENDGRRPAARRLGIGPVQAGDYNKRLVMRMIGSGDGVSRADLTRSIGLTPQAVSVIVADLLDRGYLVERDRRRGGRGYPSRQYTVNPEGAFAFGVNLDRDRLIMVLVDLEGTIRSSQHATVDFPEPELVFDMISANARDLTLEAGVDWQKIVGLGIGIPGRYDPRHAVLLPTMDSPAWKDVAVAEELQRRLGLDIYWDNDATAAAIGERFRGAGVGHDNFLYVHLGVGIGSGLVLGGEPFRGWASNAGELGRVRISPSRPVPGLDNPRPRLSEVASFVALQNRLAAAEKAVSTPEEISALLAAGDPDLAAWIHDASRALTQALCGVVYLLDLEMFVFGGVFPADVTDELASRVQHGFETRLFNWHCVPLVARGMVGANAGALGAGTLPLHASFAPGVQR